MIADSRPDYGMFIDLVEMANADAVPVSDQKRICRGAPTTSFGSSMYCWWGVA